MGKITKRIIAKCILCDVCNDVEEQKEVCPVPVTVVSLAFTSSCDMYGHNIAYAFVYFEIRSRTFCI